MGHRLNYKIHNIKLLQVNAGEDLDDLGIGRAVLDAAPKAQSLKERTGQLNFITVKIVCSVKDTVERMKRQAKTETQTETENICKRHI